MRTLSEVSPSQRWKNAVNKTKKTKVGLSKDWSFDAVIPMTPKVPTKETFEKWLEENNEYEIEIVTVGKRVRDYYKVRDIEILEYFSDWGGQLDYDRAKHMVSLLTDRFVSGDTDEITLIFTRFLSMVRYKLSTEQYLPVSRPEAVDDEQGMTGDYIFEPTSEQIYAALMPSYATTKMVTALTESFASEHGSRMIAMGNATKNAGEMVDALTLDYNKARQAQITKELLEVVSGAEALKG